MPTLWENRIFWGQHHDWPLDGHEWSSPFGGTATLWNCALWPRLLHYLPCGHILEIGCGRGRWSEYLSHHCCQYTGIDIVFTNIERCRALLPRAPHCAFLECSGTSLEMIPDASVDLIFSFDSLVHANAEIICSYLAESQRVLKEGGCLLVHHSNLQGQIPLQTPPQFYEDGWHWRSHDVSAHLVRKHSERVGLSCRYQELIKWRKSSLYIDCLSLLRKQPLSIKTSCCLVQYSELLFNGSNQIQD